MKGIENAKAASKASEPNRRRRYIINSAFQWKYALTIALMVVIMSSLMGTVLYGLLHQQARMRLMHPQTYVADVTTIILLFALGSSAVTAAGVAFWCIVTSHRICGPLYVLARYFEELVQGRLPKVRPLRRKDEFKELHAAFSGAVESLKRQKQAELTALHEAVQIAENALDGHDETRRTAIETLIGRLHSLRLAAAEALGDEARADQPARPPAARKPAPPIPVEAAC